MNRRILFVILTAMTSTANVAAQTASPYAGQHQRAIKALSEREISDLVEARGMALAKAAELNSYPGPLHVLELKRELDLTDAQRVATESLYSTMGERARPIGIKIIEAERDLDQAFANGAINPMELRSRVDVISNLQSELRIVHLETLCVPKTLSALISSRNHLTSVHNVRTVLLRPGRLSLAIQVDEPA